MRRGSLVMTQSGLVVPAVPAAYVSAAAAAVASAVATVSPSVPIGVATGKLLLVLCWANNTAATWATPSGWNAGDTFAGVGCQAFYRVADGTESGTFSFTRATSLTGAAGAIVVCVSGGQYSASKISTGSPTTSIVLSEVSAAANQSLLLQIVTNVTTSAGTFTPPGTTTERVDTTASGSAVEFAVGDEVVDFGVTGSRTWTKTLSQQSRGAMFALAPAA